MGTNSVLIRKDECVLIKCNTSGSTDRMKNELSSEMGENYEVKETKMRNPSILISNIGETFLKMKLSLHKKSKFIPQ